MIRPEGTPHNDADEARTLRLDPHPPVAGVDQWARRQYQRRVFNLTAQLADLDALPAGSMVPTVCDMRSIGWEILADAIRDADDQFDPDAYLGGVARGVVEGLREFKVMPGE